MPRCRLQSLKRAAALFVGFALLYALTAQRGLGWGDSGEFQHWVLDRTELICGLSFSNAHPLYVAFCRLVASTPFAVTLVSSFFGALAVAGLYLASRKVSLALLFGLSQMLWWLSCVAEVQTMNLAFTAFETYLLLEYLRSRRIGWFYALAFLAGLHLEVHNFALLALPVYAVIALRDRRLYFAPLAWAVGAAYWLFAVFTRGPVDVLVGVYGAKVAGALPANWLVTGFNLVLAAISFAVPVALWRWREKGGSRPFAFPAVLALFAINFLFFIRYFVPDQATFLLPSLFFAYLLVAETPLKVNRLVALALIQLLLPVAAALALESLPRPASRQEHKYRDDAQYFALPWKFLDDSADRYAAELGGTWTGYPETTTKGAR